MSFKNIHTAFFALLAVVIIAARRSSVTIVNSGSTNTAGYTIVVECGGNVQYYIAPRRAQIINSDGTAAQPSWTNGTTQLSHETTDTLYHQINQCEPFKNLTVKPCAKSVSFGYSLKLTYKGETTPDLTCPTNNENLANLTAIVNKVISESNI